MRECGTPPAGVYVWRGAVADRIESYRPLGSPSAWHRVGPEVRRIITRAEPLTSTATGEYLSILARLAVFADGEGMVASAQVWLSRPCIERFVAVGCTELSQASRGNYRSRLLRLREAVLGPDNPGGPPVKLSSSRAGAPYTTAELSRLWNWACGQPTENLRWGITTLLALGQGTGLDSAEVIPLLARDVIVVGNGAVVVHVRGPRQRRVVCRQGWEHVLAQAAQWAEKQHSDAYLFRPSVFTRGKNTVSALIGRAHGDPAVPALVQARLRIGWLVDLIEAHVPLPVIVAASGVSSLHALSRVMPYVRASGAERSAAALRGRA